MIVTFKKEDFTPPGLFGFKKKGVFKYWMLKESAQYLLAKTNKAYLNVYDNERDKKSFHNEMQEIESDQILKAREAQ